MFTLFAAIQMNPWLKFVGIVMLMVIHSVCIQGMEVLRKYEMVNLPRYKRKEMDNCLEYYSQERWFTKSEDEM